MIKSANPVYLVGAGPGDPELITVKAQRLIKSADVIVYDLLVADEILKLARPGTMRVFAGKAARNHHMPQQEINHLLACLADQYEVVVRLKGGDPFVFGRGSEEALYLAAHDIPFQIVPGVTAASGCAAYAGIPLTHRGISRSVQLMTGHSMLGRSVDEDINWQSLSDPETTLVIYMGLTNAPLIAKRLTEGGRPQNTPVAIIQEGTTPRQRTLLSTLKKLPEDLACAQIISPALFIIGDVAKLSKQLSWFNPKA